MTLLLLLTGAVTLIFEVASDRPCVSNICLNGGTCRVDEDTRVFRCDCAPGFIGTLCQDACSKPCANGLCVKGDQGQEDCLCQNGWTGPLCDVSGTSLAGCTKNGDCASDQKCVENYNGFKVCADDPCKPNPCHNNATCRQDQDDYRCECPLGYAGKKCDADVNECELNPCRNGGTCINLDGSFECLCSERHSGILCSDITHACSPSPCQNNGSCIEMVNDYRCLCKEGFTGHDCETKIRAKCLKSPCKNGGECIETEDGYKCECLSGFSGVNCEKMNECTVAGRSCMNGGSCIRGIAKTFCSCLDGFEGAHCETLVVPSVPSLAPTIATMGPRDPCVEKPCQNGGTCSISDGIATCKCPSNFQGPLCSTPAMVSACEPNPCENNGTCSAVGDPAEAGFVCDCTEGYEGTVCEQPTNQWIGNVTEIILPTGAPSSPTLSPTVSSTDSNPQATTCELCENSETCIETERGALCVCKTGYSGSRCQKKGEICDKTVCAPPLICRPRIAVQTSSAHCGCQLGRAGPSCNIDTTTSFKSDSLFIYQSPQVMIGSASGPLSYSISLSFRTTLPTVHILSGENIFGQKLFSLSLLDGRATVNVSGTVYNNLSPININTGEWHVIEMEKSLKDMQVSITDNRGYELSSRSLPRDAVFDVFSTRIGKISETEFFVGCIADVTIDGNSVSLTSNRGVHVEAGCNRRLQCKTDPCHNGGSCVDLWDRAECNCKSPYLPPYCIQSLPPSTYGKDNVPSFVDISIPQESAEKVRFETIIQMLIRTNKLDGNILYLGEQDAQDVATFMTLELANGTILARSRLGGKNIEELKSSRHISDNEQHQVRVERDHRKVKLYLDDVLEAEGEVQARFDHPLFAERLLLGRGDDAVENSFRGKENFKGSLQDVRINGFSAVLHSKNLNVDEIGHVEKMENVEEGTVSDDVCGQSRLCDHGSCSNTFNDYHCICEMGFFGKNCDKRDYCISSPCPSGGICQNVDGGFYCTTPVTLTTTSSLEYKLTSNESVETDFVEFSIRTHSDQGRIITLKTASEQLSISISYGQLVISTSSPFTIRKTVADGKWRKIRIQENVLKIDGNSYGLPSSLALPGKLEDAKLFVGTESDIPSFEGCLSDLVIGGVPKVSFYREEDFSMPKGITYWRGVFRTKVAVGCLSAAQCGPASPCLNGGTCQDHWNKVACDCPAGFSGPLCQINDNECLGVDCGNGYCIDGVGDYRCQCDPGFTGVRCDVMLDACAENPCRNGGKCSPDNRTYVCECKAGWAGKSCTIRKPESCAPNPCRNGGTCELGQNGPICECPPEAVGKYCEQLSNPCEQRPCLNGVCHESGSQYSCVCDEGYTGSSCDQFIDFCARDTCHGRGSCRPVWNSTLCECNRRSRGLFCTETVDECLSIPCENDGICSNTSNGFKCRCRKYYMGDRCEVQGSCLSAPCKHGDCVQISHDRHTCSCHKGYEGENCEKRIDYCKSDPCKNGATCESLLGEYKCNCIAGFEGRNCETDIDECALGYCANGAHCRDRVADYECMCENTGFSGKNCSEDINECLDPLSCVNGVCSNTNGGYKCQCHPGYIGRRCSLIDPCIPDKFNRTLHTCVHGKCINPTVKLEHGREVALHECRCDRGYTGPQCSTRVEERRMLALSYIIGPVVALLLVLAVMTCALFFFVYRGKRALHGHYSPSHQEKSGARLQMSHMIKLPPEERLI